MVEIENVKAIEATHSHRSLCRGFSDGANWRSWSAEKQNKDEMTRHCSKREAISTK